MSISTYFTWRLIVVVHSYGRHQNVCLTKAEEFITQMVAFLHFRIMYITSSNIDYFGQKRDLSLSTPLMAVNYLICTLLQGLHSVSSIFIVLYALRLLYALVFYFSIFFFIGITL